MSTEDDGLKASHNMFIAIRIHQGKCIQMGNEKAYCWCCCSEVRLAICDAAHQMGTLHMNTTGKRWNLGIYNSREILPLEGNFRAKNKEMHKKLEEILPTRREIFLLLLGNLTFFSSPAERDFY